MTTLQEKLDELSPEGLAIVEALTEQLIYEQLRRGGVVTSITIPATPVSDETECVMVPPPKGYTFNVTMIDREPTTQELEFAGYIMKDWHPAPVSYLDGDE